MSALSPEFSALVRRIKDGESLTLTLSCERVNDYLNYYINDGAVGLGEVRDFINQYLATR